MNRACILKMYFVTHVCYSEAVLLAHNQSGNQENCHNN